MQRLLAHQATWNTNVIVSQRWETSEFMEIHGATRLYFSQLEVQLPRTQTAPPVSAPAAEASPDRCHGRTAGFCNWIFQVLQLQKNRKSPWAFYVQRKIFACEVWLGQKVSHGFPGWISLPAWDSLLCHSDWWIQLVTFRSSSSWLWVQPPTRSLGAWLLVSNTNVLTALAKNQLLGSRLMIWWTTFDHG